MERVVLFVVMAVSSSLMLLGGIVRVAGSNGRLRVDLL